MQEIIEGVSDLSVSDFQSLLGQLAGWRAVKDQFTKVHRDTANAIYHRMAHEEGNLSLPWTDSVSSIQPFRQTGIMVDRLAEKFKSQCLHFDFESMSGSLSPLPSILYKSRSSMDSSGLLLVSNQQAPSLTQYSEGNVKIFTSRLKTQYASGITCNIPVMIPMGAARNQLRNSLKLKNLCSSDSEFDHILTQPSLFLSVMDKFLKKLNLPTGAPTDLEMIRSKLMFNIETVLDDAQVNKVIEQISVYDHDCNDVYLNLLHNDQQEYIKVFIEINSQKHLSKCQLWSRLKLQSSLLFGMGVTA